MAGIRGLTIFTPYLVAIGIGALFLSSAAAYRQQRLSYETRIAQLEANKAILQGKLDDVSKSLDDVKKEDQYVMNRALEAEIKNIRQTYDSAVQGYEELLKVRELSGKTAKLDQQFAETLAYLSHRNYASASGTLAALKKGISELQASIAAASVIPASLPVKNAPPAGGFSRQAVQTDIGLFQVDLVAGDLGTTRAIVDSASDSDCRNDCPVLSLSEYVARNGGYAGINGSYFCPASYPSCADKKNSFDTLLMNVRKQYLNSDNNVYSVVPAVIFLGNSVRFAGRSLDWGRDTGGDGVLANQPLLVSGGSVVFGGDGDPKKGSKGPRSFVANKGTTVFIGVVQNATVAEAARVMHALGMDNALNLDSGGSTALWYSGYKAGPGRNIPNAIVFVRR